LFAVVRLPWPNLETGVIEMIDIGAMGRSIAATSYEVDREAYVARSVAASQGAAAAGAISKAVTADELNKQLDADAAIRVKAAETTVGLARGHFTIISCVKDNGGGTSTILSGEAAALYRAQQPPDPVRNYVSAPAGEFASFTALNIDSVMKNISTDNTAANYATYVKSEVENLKSNHDQVLFVGARGKGLYTLDVDEYIGWLNEAVSKRAANLAKIA
jgi:hypothetical protein